MKSNPIIHFNSNSKRKICGIKNLGRNCYLNAGLQIIASCEEFIKELNKIKNENGILSYIKDAIYSLLTNEFYDPSRFIDYFCSQNLDFVKGIENCSQTFIRTLINNINSDCLKYKDNNIVLKNELYNDLSSKYYDKYNKFIESNKIYPESKILSIFSGITIYNSKGKCYYCNGEIDNCSFNNFIDLNLYLDEIYYNCNFSNVLDTNLSKGNELIMKCPKCKKEISIKEETKLIKFPEIFIFTLERYQGETNNVEIKPDEIIYMQKYKDENVIIDFDYYELFAINIRFGRNADFGHEICQVKRNGFWYEIDDWNSKLIKKPSYYDYSYGLFYKKKKISPDSYINAGIEILSLFNELITELRNFKMNPNYNSNLLNLVLDVIGKNKKYEANDLTKIPFIEKVNNSQEFIIHLINFINDEFMRLNFNIIDLNISTNLNQNFNEYKSIKESQAKSIFSFILKNNLKGYCDRCRKNINTFTFTHDIQLIFFLGKNKSAYYYIPSLFEDNLNYISSDDICPECKKNIKLEIVKQFTKLPEYLIFSIDRNNETNNKIEIKLEPTLEIEKFIDISLKEKYIKYELVAINIKDNNQYYCDIKKNGNWYEINKGNYNKIDFPYKNNSICGLFYKKIKSFGYY